MTRFIRFDKFFTNSLIIITLTRAKMKQVKSFIDRLISVSAHAERERESPLPSAERMSISAMGERERERERGERGRVLQDTHL